MNRFILFAYLYAFVFAYAPASLSDVEKPYDETKLDYFETDSIEIDFLNRSWNIPVNYFKEGKTIGQMLVDGFDAADQIMDASNPPGSPPSNLFKDLLGKIDINEPSNLPIKALKIPGSIWTIIPAGKVCFFKACETLWDPVKIDTSVSLEFNIGIVFNYVSGADELLRTILENDGMKLHQQIEVKRGDNKNLINYYHWKQAIGRPMLKDLRVSVENGTATLYRAGKDFPVLPAPEDWPIDEIRITNWRKYPWAEEVPWITEEDHRKVAAFRTHDITGPTGDPNSRTYKVTGYDESTGKLTISLKDPDQDYPLTFEAGGTGIRLREPHIDYTGTIFGLGLTKHGKKAKERIIPDLSAPKLFEPREVIPESGLWLLDYEIDLGNVNWSALSLSQPNPKIDISLQAKVEGTFLGAKVDLNLLDPLKLKLLENLSFLIPATTFTGNYQFYVDPSRGRDQVRFSGLSDINWEAFGLPTAKDLCNGDSTCNLAMTMDLVDTVINRLPRLIPCLPIPGFPCYSNAEVIRKIFGSSFEFPKITIEGIIRANNTLLFGEINKYLANKVVPSMINAANDTLWTPGFPKQTEKFWIMDGINTLFDPIASRAQNQPEPEPDPVPVPTLGPIGSLLLASLVTTLGLRSLYNSRRRKA